MAYKHGYTNLDNAPLHDKRLSYKALGLYWQICACPDKWEHSVSGYSSLHYDGEDGVKSGLKELEQYGYLKRQQSHKKDGGFGKQNYIIIHNDKPP